MPPPQSLLVIDDSEAERELIAIVLDAAFPCVNVCQSAFPMLAKQACREQDSLIAQFARCSFETPSLPRWTRLICRSCLLP